MQFGQQNSVYSKDNGRGWLEVPESLGSKFGSPRHSVAAALPPRLSLNAIQAQLSSS